MNRFKLLIPLAFGFILSGCSVMAVKKYDPHFKNTREIEKVKTNFKEVEVKGSNAEVTKRVSSPAINCRLTTFNMPANKDVKGYIKDALTDELDAAKKLTASGKTISITVNKLDSDTSSFSKGNWTVDFDYSLNGTTKNIKTITAYESAYMADTACRNAANALEEALRENFIAYFKEIQTK